MNDLQAIYQVITIGIAVADFLLTTGRGFEAIKLREECPVFLNNKALEIEEQFAGSPYSGVSQMFFRALQYRLENELALTYEAVAAMSCLQGKCVTAKELFKKALAINKRLGDKKREAANYEELGSVFQLVGQYFEAQRHHEKALAIAMEISDRNREASSYGKLGAVFISLGEYVKAENHLEKALAIQIKVGDRSGEALSYEYYGRIFHCLGEYVKAKKYHEKALAIKTEIGDSFGEAASYVNLGSAFQSLGQCFKAKTYYEKALAIAVETSNKKGEASIYQNLGNLFLSLGEYVKAKNYLEKALAITIEIGDRNGEASCYGSLVNVFYYLGEYDKAKESHKKALSILKGIGDRKGEATSYGNIAIVFSSLGKYVKAKNYLEKALVIQKKIGDRTGEASSYGNLGNLFHSLGEYVKAKKYHEKALAINKEIGDRHDEASSYGNLGIVFYSVSEYVKAKEYQEKALAINIEIGDRYGEASSYGNLGTVSHFLGDHDKSKQYQEKALAIRIEIGDREGEATSYLNLGYRLLFFGEFVMAEEHLEKALSIVRDIGHSKVEFACHCNLTTVKLLQGKIQEAYFYMSQSIRKCEHLRSVLADNDQFKVSFSDVSVFPYRKLSELLCAAGSPNEALYVVELGRARALADLMTTRYSVKMQISADPRSWVGMENIMKKESNCTCMYISYNYQQIFLWILNTNGVIHFRRIKVNEDIVHDGPIKDLDDFFSKSFRSFGVLSEDECEDRSLNDTQTNSRSSREESSAALRLLEEEDDEERQELEPSLALYYEMLITPVADLLEDREIIIAPDRALYRVPFAALHDESGKYLSESYRIRIVPSLTTLKLIQDCPTDYHSQTGALIVGDPKVGQVLYKGRLEGLSRLPFAGKEAEMIGRLLGVQPLLGEHATKQAVLQRISSVSLIHFAAHGNAERGEIALAPEVTSAKIPEEEDYLLTMSDISQVQLRAKLVVLSCCHSASGQIKAEGVVGIARAFLGSGARSVLVALWAIEDTATEQFMSRFYEHLVRGESASECLHQAVKWMRANGYSDVRQWAPFMLIGDNVTFDFGK